MSARLLPDKLWNELQQVRQTLNEGARFTVDTALDTSDSLPGDGFARDAHGRTSLRAAIEESNALTGKQFIAFNLLTCSPNPGPCGMRKISYH